MNKDTKMAIFLAEELMIIATLVLAEKDRTDEQSKCRRQYLDWRLGKGKGHKEFKELLLLKTQQYHDRADEEGNVPDDEESFQIKAAVVKDLYKRWKAMSRHFPNLILK